MSSRFYDQRRLEMLQQRARRDEAISQFHEQVQDTTGYEAMRRFQDIVTGIAERGVPRVTPRDVEKLDVQGGGKFFVDPADVVDDGGKADIPFTWDDFWSGVYGGIPQWAQMFVDAFRGGAEGGTEGFGTGDWSKFWESQGDVWNQFVENLLGLGAGSVAQWLFAPRLLAEGNLLAQSRFGDWLGALGGTGFIMILLWCID